MEPLEAVYQWRQHSVRRGTGATCLDLKATLDSALGADGVVSSNQIAGADSCDYLYPEVALADTIVTVSASVSRDTRPIAGKPIRIIASTRR